MIRGVTALTFVLSRIPVRYRQISFMDVSGSRSLVLFTSRRVDTFWVAGIVLRLQQLQQNTTVAISVYELVRSAQNRRGVLYLQDSIKFVARI